jgi:hypothetical protein
LQPVEDHWLFERCSTGRERRDELGRRDLFQCGADGELRQQAGRCEGREPGRERGPVPELPKRAQSADAGGGAAPQYQQAQYAGITPYLGATQLAGQLPYYGSNSLGNIGSILGNYGTSTGTSTKPGGWGNDILSAGMAALPFIL